MLPPGLVKKPDRNKPLPPGWQKKLKVGDRLDPDLYERGEVIERDRDEGLITIRVEGKLIRLVHKTREIIDIIDAL